MVKRINKKFMAKLMPTISTPPAKTTAGDIGDSHQGQHIPTRIQDLNVSGQIFDGAFMTYDINTRRFKYVSGTSTGGEANTASNIGTGIGIFSNKSGVDLRLRSILGGTGITVVQNGGDIEIRNNGIIDCTNVISCVENVLTLNLNNLNVSGDTILNDLSFSGGAVIDYTNSTSTGIQNFDNSYVANYDGSTINYDNVTAIYTNSNVTFDNSSTLNLSENTYINGQLVATQADVVGFANWKETVRLATTNTSDVTAYTYNPGNEPTGDVWTGVNSAPTIDGNILNDGDRLLIKDAGDARGNGIFIYSVANSAFIRSADADNSPQEGEIASMMVGIHDGDTNYGKIFREIHTSNITLGTDTVDMTPFIISVVAGETNTSSNEGTGVGIAMAKSGVNLPFKSLVAGANIALTDNGDEILIDSTGGAGMTCADVINCVEDASDLYLTNVNVTLGDVVNTGDTTYVAGSTIDYTNSVSTGVQNFNSTYVANYDGSTINYTNNTTVNQDSSSIYNNNGTTNNYATSVINNEGNTTNNNNATINNTSTFTSLGCSGNTPTPVDVAIQASATKADVTIDYDDGSTTDSATVTITEQTGVVTTTILDATFTTEWNTTSGNIEVRQTGGIGTSTADVCQFSGGTIINNDGTINNNTNTVTNYDDTTVVNMEGDTNISNLTVENITVAGGGVVSVEGAWEYEETPDNVTTYTLTNTPISDKGFMVFVDSGTGLFPTTDYTYNSATQEITFSPQLGVNEHAVIWVMVGSSANIVGVKPSNLDAINAPIDDYVAKKVAGSDQFEWVEEAFPIKTDGVTWGVTGTNTTIVDSNVTTGTVILGWTVTSGTQAGYREFTMSNGSFDITSSTSEDGALIFNYVIIN